MHDLLGPGTVVGYCTNVHAGSDYAQMLENLDRYAVPVKQRVSPAEPMGVGLWLAAQTAAEIIQQQRLDELASWLRQKGLLAYTLNGFPYGDFHQPVVKHRVYQPEWHLEERLNYTLDLIAILAKLLPSGSEGSISTVPLGWRQSLATNGLRQAARHLRQLADHLYRVEQETGRLIHLDLEPEPGCCLDTSRDVVQLYKQHLLASGDERHVLRYLRVCHDICHSAVMFEDQHTAWLRYRAVGIQVGKVQVSSAVRAPFDKLDDAQRSQALDQLRQFQEDRYLHQTVVRHSGQSHATSFYEDLPEALKLHSLTGPPQEEWRIHFHVPIYLEQFGLLETTREQIGECLHLLGPESEVRHFEVETYAWGVLPKDLQCDDLAQGIARELEWFREQSAARADA